MSNASYPSSWLVRKLIVPIAPVICHLCNMPIQSGTLPAILKQARVLPQLKKQTLDPGSWIRTLPVPIDRPISILSYLSKVIERVVARRSTVHISDSHLLPAQQYAYRAFHSTETAVLSVRCDLMCAIDIGQLSLLVLLHLCAAFDTVDHSMLLKVLSISSVCVCVCVAVILISLYCDSVFSIARVSIERVLSMFCCSRFNVQEILCSLICVLL